MAFVVAMDTSMNFRFLGCVAGELSSIRRLHRKIIEEAKISRIHMSELPPNVRKKIISMARYLLQFGLITICIRFDLRRLAKLISKTTRKPYFMARELVMSHIFRRIRRILEPEVPSISRVYIDRELTNYENAITKVFRAPTMLGGTPTEIADLIAYLNKSNNEKYIDYTIELSQL